MLAPQITPSLAVIIPAFNASKTIVPCLQSVLRSGVATDKIIVVDDGSTDSTLALARKFGVKVVQQPRSGPAAARNLGAGMVDADIFFFLDSDCTLAVDAMDRVGQFFADNPRIDALIGSYDDLPAESNVLSQYKNLMHHRVHQDSAGHTQTFWSACGAIRREAFCAVGGFEEGFARASVEDIHLGYRLRDAGFFTVLDPSIQVRHWKKWTALNLLQTDFCQRAIPWSLMILSGGGYQETLNISSKQRSKVMVAVLAVAFALTTWFYRPAFFGVLLSLIGLLVLDWDQLKWLKQKRGVCFTACVLPWHWLSHLYSGIGFTVAMIIHRLGKTPPHLNLSLSRLNGLVPITSSVVSDEPQESAPYGA
jgi:glycosyltransferase involved in cell wall biosynthesis